MPTTQQHDTSAPNSTVNVICLKFGDYYSPEYINKLYRGVKRNLSRPFRFICVTEKPEGILPEVETILFPLPKGMPEQYRRGLDQARRHRRRLS